MPKKRTSPNRNVQIADQIQRDLSELLREVKDPRIGIVTIQSVELTPDYAHAKVFFTTLTGDPQQTLEALNHAAGHLHNLLFKRLHIHTVPTLHFHYDQTVVRAVEMSKLIDEANSTRPKIPRRVLDGVLLLDKPLGLSSNDALIRAKKIYLAKKAGHTGTLDPL